MPLTPEEQDELLSLLEEQTSGKSSPSLSMFKSGAMAEGAETNPLPTDLHGGHLARTKASFGNAKGLADELAARGFVDAKYGPDGEVIARGADGKWYRDEANFTENPLKWAESSAGKALPMAGAIAGGLAGSGLASIPLAGVGGAGGEGYRQTIGSAMGVYDGDEGERLTEVGIEGAVSALGEGIAQGVSRGVVPTARRMLGKAPSELVATTTGEITGDLPQAARSTGEAMATTLKNEAGELAPNAAKVRAAASGLPGAPQVPDWALSTDPMMHDLAGTALRSPTIGGAMVRREIDPLKKATFAAAQDVTSGALEDQTEFQVGQSLREELGSAFKSKLAPAVATYDELNPVFKSIPLERRGFERQMSRLMQDSNVKADPEVRAFLGTVQKQFEGVENLADLKGLRSFIGRTAKEKGGTFEYAAGRLYEALTNERDRSLYRNILDDKPVSGVKNILKAARENPTVQKLRDADRLYRSATEETSEALGLPGSKSRMGASRRVEKFLADMDPEKIPDWLFNPQKVEQLQKFAKAYPEQFEKVRRERMARLVEKTTDPSGRVNPARLAQMLKKYSPEAKQMLFGEKAGMLNDLLTVQKTMPGKFNPSDTDVRMEWRDFLNFPNQAQSMRFPIQLKTQLPIPGVGNAADLASKAIAPLESEALTRPAAQAGVRVPDVLPSPEREEKSKRDFLDNN